MFLRKINFRFLHNFKFWFVLVILFYIFSSSIYAIASLVKHSHYETFGDLAVFNQGIWQYSRLEWPFITLHLGRLSLGDHFHPILILLAPLYWFYSSEKVLLFIQPFVILSAMIPLFLIGVKLTKSCFFSLAVITAYALYIPLQYTIFYDFHEIVFFPPLFAWTYYFYISERRSLVSIFLLLSLLVKEELGFFIASFGLYVFFTNKSWRKFGLIWFFAGISYSLMMMYYIIPKIGGSYLYFDYGVSGKTPIDVILYFINNPLSFIKLFFDPAVKVETLYRTFWPFAFLPLLSPLGILLSLEQFFSRFADFRTVTRWTIGYHYSAIMSIVVALTTICSVGFYLKFVKHKTKTLILLGLLLLFLTRVEQINASAILLIKNPNFWQRSRWMDNIDQAIKLIPKESSVATQNNIVSHLSTRKLIFLLKDMDRADYILADLHPGQPDYNFFGAEQKQLDVEALKYKLSSGKYQTLYVNQEVYLLKKI